MSSGGFTEHVATITRQCHQRANLIHRCFTSKDCSMLVKAFITFVRPIVEYNSPVWSPNALKDINRIEAVRRRFTKGIPGMSGRSSHSRLKMLNLHSLELRRLRADLLLVYKILFGLLHTNTETLFTLRAHAQLRGHQYYAREATVCLPIP